MKNACTWVESKNGNLILKFLLVVSIQTRAWLYRDETKKKKENVGNKCSFELQKNFIKILSWKESKNSSTLQCIEIVFYIQGIIIHSTFDGHAESAITRIRKFQYLRSTLFLQILKASPMNRTWISVTKFDQWIQFYVLETSFWYNNGEA